LLFDIIDKHRNWVGAKALSALQEVVLGNSIAKISFGKDYCSKASKSEFQLFLRGLQNNLNSNWN